MSASLVVVPYPPVARCLASRPPATPRPSLYHVLSVSSDRVCARGAGDATALANYGGQAWLAGQQLCCDE